MCHEQGRVLIQVAGDRSNQPLQRLPVEMLRPSERVQDLGRNHPGIGITDVVGRLQVVRNRAALFNSVPGSGVGAGLPSPGGCRWATVRISKLLHEEVTHRRIQAVRIRYAVELPDQPQRSQDEHLAILAAVANGDTDHAVDLLLAHITTVRDLVLPLVRDSQPV